MYKDLVILAAGMGSRYGGLKQIDPVGPGGERILDYSIYDARRAGFNRVVFVIRRDMEDAFRDSLGRAMEKHIEVAYAYQALEDLPAPFTVPAGREKPWGTCHAVYAARDVIRGPFSVINADDFYGPTAFRLLADHLENEAALPEHTLPCHAMIAYELERTASAHGTVSRGLCRTDAAGFLLDIEEVTAIAQTPDGLTSKDAGGSVRIHDPKTPTSMNCWGFTPALLADMEGRFRDFLSRHGTELKSECYLPGTVGELIDHGKARVRVLTTPDPWFGVTYREDKPTVMRGIQQLVDRGMYNSPLWDA